LLSHPVKVPAPRYHFNALAVKQISAIAAYAGLSVEVKESTSDIIKTPTLTSKDGFSVFEASAIGRYSESYCLVPEVKRPRLSQIFHNSNTRKWKTRGAGLSDCLLGAKKLYCTVPAPDNVDSGRQYSWMNSFSPVVGLL
jgi:hypothetical protein